MTDSTKQSSAPLAGRSAVITGGGRGLGWAMARALGRAGAQVMLLDLLEDTEASAKRLAAETGVPAAAVRCDVTDADSVDAALEAATATVGVPTILVNAAGIALTEPALTTSAEQWRRIIDVNLTGTFLTCQAFARRVIDAGRSASIVNVASMSGMVVNVPQTQAGYNASKAGVSMLTASLAVEWLPYGIRVNAVAPGYFASAMTKDVASSDPGMHAEWMRRTPAGRMGEPDELGPLVVYLCGEDSAFVVGQSIVIDGGYTLV